MSEEVKSDPCKSVMVTDLPTTPKGPIIKIADSKAVQKEKADFRKQVEIIGSETLDEFGNPKSYRNEDLFMGGPYNGHTCEHSPNGPRAHNDPKGYWADYFIKDKMKIPETGSWVTGYHLYSTSRSIYSNGEDGMILKEHQSQMGGLGSRGPNMRKLYYYCGWFDEGFLTLGGLSFDEFTGYLSA